MPSLIRPSKATISGSLRAGTWLGAKLWIGCKWRKMSTSTPRSSKGLKARTSYRKPDHSILTVRLKRLLKLKLTLVTTSYQIGRHPWGIMLHWVTWRKLRALESILHSIGTILCKTILLEWRKQRVQPDPRLFHPTAIRLQLVNHLSDSATCRTVTRQLRN
jgi:hypothetical protein